MKKLLVLVVVILIAAGLFAQEDKTFGSGQWLYGCSMASQRITNGNETENDGFDAGEYHGFVMAVCEVGLAEGWLIIPSNAALWQIEMIVGKFLENNPERWNQPAIGSAIWALHAVRPRPKKPGE